MVGWVNLVLLAIAFCAGWATNGWRLESSYSKEKIAQVEVVQVKTQEQTKIAERIDREVVVEKRVAVQRAESRAVAGNGLRIKLEAFQYPTLASPTGECSVERADSAHLAKLLDESRVLLEEGSRITDEAVILIDGLQKRDQAL